MRVWTAVIWALVASITVSFAAAAPAKPTSPRKGPARTTKKTQASVAPTASKPAEVVTGPGIYVAWRQPYGEIGFQRELTAPCNDTSWVDTLYLTFELSRPTPGIAGINATIYFHPQPGDSMGAFWHFKSGQENGGNMWIDLSPYVSLPGFAPWGEVGYYELGYDHRSGRGRLDIEYVIPPEKSVALEPNRRYTFARVRLLHRRSELSGCAQPICVEWASARLRFATSRELDLPSTGSRYAGLNDIAGVACGTARGKLRAKPWQPKPN